MKQIIFTYNDIKSINIGDYIQSLAASQFLSSDPVYINRDELGLYDGEGAKVIMNGWYTYKPSTCLPSKTVMPLFVSFHLNTEAKDSFFTTNNIALLKQYAPIGCRDEYTARILQEYGIVAYYSGCLTMTLGHRFNFLKRNDDIFIVDPYAYLPGGKNPIEILKTSFQYVLHYRGVRKLIKKYREDNPFTINLSKIGIGRLLLVTKTYLLLKNLLEDEVIWNARYITQLYMNEEYPTDESRFKRAYELLQLYAGAKYVITSRIHCAFPCLGLQTPVAYLKNSADGEKSLCRLENVPELLNVVELNGERIVSSFVEGKFSFQTQFQNKSAYLKYRNSLIEKCVQFIKA